MINHTASSIFFTTQCKLNCLLQVVPEIVTEMGHPIRLLVVEQISSLHATLVVFDRHHHKKYIEYYAEKIPCNMVVMNDNGDVDLIKKRTTFQTEVDNINRIYYSTAAGASPSASPMPRPHCSNAIISQNIKKYIKSKTRFMQQTSQGIRGAGENEKCTGIFK